MAFSWGYLFSDWVPKLVKHQLIYQVQQDLANPFGATLCLRSNFKDATAMHSVCKSYLHFTLDMVKGYLALSNSGTAAAHKKASPADKWKL